jgi:hypothetical protein
VLEDMSREHGCDQLGDGRKLHSVRDAVRDVRVINPASSVIDLILGNIESGNLVEGLGNASAQATGSAADFDAVSGIATILPPLGEEVLPVGSAERVKFIVGPGIVAAFVSVFPAGDGEKRIGFSPLFPLLV